MGAIMKVRELLLTANPDTCFVIYDEDTNSLPFGFVYGTDCERVELAVDILDAYPNVLDLHVLWWECFHADGYVWLVVSARNRCGYVPIDTDC